MVNKRFKQQAVKSFAKVVDFGKKLEKRKDSSGMLKGITVKQKK